MSNYISNIGVNYFTFDRTYHDGSHIRLTSNSKWIEHYYKNKLYRKTIYENPNLNFAFSFIMWKDSPQTKICLEAKEFNVRNGLTINRPNQEYCDFFHFGFNANINPYEYLSSLYNFTKQFVSLEKERIQSLENHRFVLPDIMPANVQDRISIKLKTKFYIPKIKNSISLSLKEIDVIELLIKGNKDKEIAEKLNNSHRTIQFHIAKIKNKLNCTNLAELGFVISKYKIDNFFKG